MIIFRKHSIKELVNVIARFSVLDDYPGDEDNGSMSAWYIFAALGMYRLCPGKNEWIKCKRLVKKAKILGKEI